MIQRVLNSKNFIAFVLASATGMTLYFLLPFPAGNFFLRLIAVNAPLVYSGAKCSYTVMLFTTPYIILSILLSGLYIFTLKIRKRVFPARLPVYPDPQHRDKLFLVVGEVHDPRKAIPAENPHWLTIPERGLYTGIAILGAVGTGKTSYCMFPSPSSSSPTKPRTKRSAWAASYSKSKATSVTRSEESQKGISEPKTISKSACTPSTAITPCTTIWTRTPWPTASQLF